MPENTCANCRFAFTHKRPKIIGATGFDDQLIFEDVDETVYSCRAVAWESLSEVAAPLSEHTGKEIGLTPISCPAWTGQGPLPPRSVDRLAELDRMIAARDARVAAKEAE